MAVNLSENQLRTERIYQKVVEKSIQILENEDSVDCYPKMRGIMEDLDRSDLELLEIRMRDALVKNDRFLIEKGIYTEKGLSTENVTVFKKWHHNCVRLGRLFSMHRFVVTSEEEKALMSAIAQNSMFLNPTVSRKILI